VTIESCAAVQSTLQPWRAPGPWMNDLTNSVDAGLCGICLGEAQLVAGKDMQSSRDLIQSALRATAVEPILGSILPAPGEEPSDVEERIELLCRSVRRLAPFDPLAVAIEGQTEGANTDLSQDQVVLDGIRKIARTGAWLHPHGVDIALRSGSMGAGAETVAALVKGLKEPNLRVTLEASKLASLAELEYWAANVSLIVTVRVRVEVRPDLRLSPVFATREVDLDAVALHLYRAGFWRFYEVELGPPPPGSEASASDARTVELLVHARDVVRASVRPHLIQKATA
jgi:hypothetical protein